MLVLWLPQPPELTPLPEEKKVRGQGDQPGTSRAPEDEALVRSFKLALRRLIQGPTKISPAPKEKKPSLKFPSLS